MSRRFMRSSVVLGALALILLTAACSSGGSSPQSSARSATKVTATPTPIHTDHAAEIDQQNMTFIPAQVSIKVGQTVLIKNSETTIHTANINGKNITGNMKKGDSKAWTATAPGQYQVSCDYHPQMHATIVVTP